jgi:hypothetical protein
MHSEPTAAARRAMVPAWHYSTRSNDGPSAWQTWRPWLRFYRFNVFSRGRLSDGPRATSPARPGCRTMRCGSSSLVVRRGQLLSKPFSVRSKMPASSSLTRTTADRARSCARSSRRLTVLPMMGEARAWLVAGIMKAPAGGIRGDIRGRGRAIVRHAGTGLSRHKANRCCHLSVRYAESRPKKSLPGGASAAIAAFRESGIAAPLAGAADTSEAHSGRLLRPSKQKTGPPTKRPRQLAVSRKRLFPKSQFPASLPPAFPSPEAGTHLHPNHGDSRRANRAASAMSADVAFGTR